MPRKNVTAAPPAIPDWDRADAALYLIRDLDVRIARREAEKTAALAALQEAHDANIKPLIRQRDGLGDSLDAFTAAHLADLGPGRSRQLNHGRVGIRLGNRALKTLSKWTWDKVLAALKAAGATQFIRVREDVDREALLDPNLSDAVRREFGCRVDQAERIFHETKTDDTIAPSEVK